MPFNKDNTGDPFRGDFPRRDGQGEWDEFGALEQRQLAIARLRQENGYPLRVALDTLLSAGYPEPGFGQALKILPGM
jgi:hypothetical protein